LSESRIEDLVKLLENPEQEIQRDKEDSKKKICQNCHHYQETPKKGINHRCPLNADGSKRTCKDWAFCPTAYRKGHPEVDINPQTKQRIEARIAELNKESIEKNKNTNKIPINPYYEQVFREMKKNNIS
jgi:hypothetical protein